MIDAQSKNSGQGNLVRYFLIGHKALHQHAIGIHYILPPIIGNSIRSPADPGEMVQPPYVMGANITITPIIRIHLPD